MAKFVLAGRADCPFFAKAEILADYLQKNLPNFRIHKIKQHPDFWEQWLKDLCKKNQWSHQVSPIIWRELLDRGGKGLLLGGLNEFLEYSQLYYGISSNMTSEEMWLIAEENLQSHIEEELEKEELESLINPLQVWICRGSAPACYTLIPILASGEVFGMETEISIHLLDSHRYQRILEGLVIDAQDLAAPLLRNISKHTDFGTAFFEADVIILLDDTLEKEVLSLELCLRGEMTKCRRYGSLIEKNAKREAKVIVAGRTFVNLKTLSLMKYAPSIRQENIIAVAMLLENKAKALLARKLRITSSGIKDVIVWGNITGSNYIDLRKAKLYRYDSAIWGPPNYSRPLLGMIYDSEWINKEFKAELNLLNSSQNQSKAISPAHSIATTLKYWYQDSPPGEIVSLGVISNGQFGIPEGIVFSMPVKFQNGKWIVLTDLENVEIKEETMKVLVSDLIQEKLVAFGEASTYQPYTPVVAPPASPQTQESQEEEQFPPDEADYKDQFSPSEHQSEILEGERSSLYSENTESEPLDLLTE
ncbi:putative malate dehydrogenase 1B isoform X1 [Tachyglossus aculeatus]|uniref:putative malate dehydrogenase 1B isoform X1 n=1 Tax=Tachyglossus aculeatus TaxID=9261 RepID=UPI0018F6BE49|nr:putative malate dehydrogenase 1B isoform X1 [Tachyglossus aculeatus]